MLSVRLELCNSPSCGAFRSSTNRIYKGEGATDAVQTGFPKSYNFQHSYNPLTMKRSENAMERRKFTRYRTNDDAFAAIRGKYSCKVGRIRDISLNGLSFTYLSEQISEKGFNHVDIFLTDNGFFLHQVPCAMLYNVIDSKSNFLAISLYRCGMKFGELNEEQQNGLDFFLNYHTINEVKTIPPNIERGGTA